MVYAIILCRRDGAIGCREWSAKWRPRCRGPFWLRPYLPFSTFSKVHSHLSTRITHGTVSLQRNCPSSSEIDVHRPHPSYSHAAHPSGRQQLDFTRRAEVGKGPEIDGFASSATTWFAVTGPHTILGSLTALVAGLAYLGMALRGGNASDQNPCHVPASDRFTCVSSWTSSLIRGIVGYLWC